MTLKNELTNDPLNLGYAGKTDAERAAILNAASATITLSFQPKNVFLLMTAFSVVRIATDTGTDGQPLASKVGVKWQALIDQARAADPGSVISLAGMTSHVFGDPVADRIMSQAEYDALTTRVGTRAEVLFGQGSVITETQVGEARNEVSHV